MTDEQQKKRHHYVPVSYLKEFVDPKGRIFAYRKDAPEHALHLKPEEIAFERYYYSQPLPDNKQDNNKIEDFFSIIETPWPVLVANFRNRETSTHTGHTFITSDNPVVYFDPDTPEAAAHPYDVKLSKGRIELLFPISPDLMVIGRTEWKRHFSTFGISFFDLFDKSEAKRINRQIARFGYRLIFSNESGHKALVRKYAATSPVLETSVENKKKESLLLFRMKFGTRRKKAKWNRPLDQRFGSD